MRKILNLISLLLVLTVGMMSACSMQSKKQYADSLLQLQEVSETTTSANSDADYTLLYQSVKDAAVTVLTQNNTIGTGFIVNAERGYVLTSRSLFDESGTTSAKVVLSDNTSVEAVMQDYDGFSVFGNRAALNSDIALIKADISETVLPSEVTFTNDNSLEYGDGCFSIASIALEDGKYLDGMFDANIVSDPNNSHGSGFYFSDGQMFFDESVQYLIQTGLTSNEGNQGAPLFNTQGQVVGMINRKVNETMMYKDNSPIGITFATPASYLCDFLHEHGVEYQFSESEAAQSENVILNADSLISSSDRVAKILMNLDSRHPYGSDDYFVVSESSSNKVIMAASENITLNTSLSAREIGDFSFKKCLKIVVYSEESSWLGSTNPMISEGSGFLINKDGYVLTNLHVINKLAGTNQSAGKLANSKVDTSGIYVYGIFEQGTCEVFEYGALTKKFLLFPMEVVSQHKDGDLDLAVLKFKNSFYFEDTSGQLTLEGKTVSRGFPESCVLADKLPNKGGRVFAVGNALGYGVSITTGIVSDPDFSAYYSDYGYNMIQMDCPINSGNSGGALFDASGRVVGINTLGLSGEAVTDLGYENISFAIPSQIAIDYLQKLNISYTKS